MAAISSTTTINNGTPSTPPWSHPAYVADRQRTIPGRGNVSRRVGSPFGVILAEIVNKGVQIESMVTALETKGLLQRLAEPNLVALSGDYRKLSGGRKIPVPTIS